MTNFNSVVPVSETSINGKLQPTVSAKQLHSFLSVGRDFSTWIKSRIDEYGFSFGEDFILSDYSPKLGKNTQRGRPEKDYILTIGMAKELAMLENNEHGRSIRKYFIRCEEQLKQIAPAIQKTELKRLKARIEVASYSKPMCDALVLQRLKQGKETYPKDYTNEFNMINRIALGVTAKQFRLANNITGDIRDYLNEQQLNHLAYLESSNITLIEMGLDYQQRKLELTKLSQSYMIRLLGEAA